jgi:hypothetical protein
VLHRHCFVSRKAAPNIRLVPWQRWIRGREDGPAPRPKNLCASTATSCLSTSRTVPGWSSA